MKKYVLFSIFLISAFYTKSQSVDRSVIAPAGGVDKSGNFSLEWTLGETIAASSGSDTKLYTQGFNQPMLKVKYKTLIDPSFNTYKITVAPNPVQSILNVYWWSDKESAISLQLSDASGRILENRTIHLKSGNTQFNMQNLAGGMYFLQARNNKGQLINTYQVVKSK